MCSGARISKPLDWSSTLNISNRWCGSGPGVGVGSAIYGSFGSAGIRCQHSGTPRHIRYSDTYTSLALWYVMSLQPKYFTLWFGNRQLYTVEHDSLLVGPLAVDSILNNEPSIAVKNVKDYVIKCRWRLFNHSKVSVFDFNNATPNLLITLFFLLIFIF